MSVSRAQEEISSHEFSSWIAYYNIEPFGEERDDLRSGIVAATFANAHIPKGKPGVKPSDFMPFSKRQAKVQSTDEMWQVLLVGTQKVGGKVIA